MPRTVTTATYMKTLDIPEAQVLIGMTDADEEYLHHILLGRIREAVWITVDPQLKVVVEDLSNEEVVPLGRDVEFPMPSRPYLALDDLSEAQMATLRSAAAVIASIHGITLRPPVPTAGLDTTEWRYSDTALEVFGLVVPPTCLASNDTILAGSWQLFPSRALRRVRPL